MTFKKPRTLKRIKRIEPDLHTKRIIELSKGKKNRDIWGYNGEKARFNEIYIKELQRKPLRFLMRLKKQSPKIMVLGPGNGMDIPELHAHLNKYGITPEVDVFGLTKSITSKAKEFVKKDLSQNVALESVIAYPEKYPELINAMKGKYDLIMASMSIGFHTNYPERTCFATALMLSQKGRAYVEIRPTINIEKHIKFIRNAIKVYNRKNNTNLDFNLNIIERNYDKNRYLYLEINRIN